MKGYVYILRGLQNKFYIGSTEDLRRRLHQHELGHTQTTRNMKDVSLAFSQEFPSLKIARMIELKLKKLKRKDYLEKIIKDGYIKVK